MHVCLGWGVRGACVPGLGRGQPRGIVWRAKTWRVIPFHVRATYALTHRSGLARAAARGRYAAQLDGVLADLGPMPDADRPNTRALWVAGLINPVSKHGLALDVRPELRASSKRALTRAADEPALSPRPLPRHPAPLPAPPPTDRQARGRQQEGSSAPCSAPGLWPQHLMLSPTLARYALRS